MINVPGHRRLRRLPKLIMVMIAVLVLAGCTFGGAQAQQGPITLTILSHYGSDPSKSGLQTMLDQWNADHDDIKVRSEVVNFTDLLTTLNVRQTGGRGADIVSAYGLWGGNLARSGVLATPPAAVADDIKHNYNPAARGAVTGPDGKIYGYPTELNTYVLFYNKKIFRQNGITKPPRTWAELKSVAAKVARTDKSGNSTVEGISLMQDGDNESVHPYLSLLDSAGGRFLGPNGRAAFDNKTGESALQLEDDLVRDGLSHPDIDPTSQFPTGRVAMAIQAGWWLGSLKSQMGDDYADVGTAPIPGPTPGSHGSLAYGFFMGVNARSRHQAASWKFLQWLNSHRTKDGITGMDAMMTGMGELPTRTDDAKKLSADLPDANLGPVYDAIDYAMAEPSVDGAYQAKTDLHTQLMTTLVNGTPPQQTLAAAADQINLRE